MSVGCSLRFLWEDIRDDILERLSTTTFGDLMDRAGGPWQAPETLRPLSV
jgi:DNA-binding IscR family transcriptional regulator